MNCTIEGCTRSPFCKGVCRMHYSRMRNGTPLDAPVGAAIVARTPWSATDDAVLERVYARGGVRAVQALLPDRPKSGIVKRAGYLGLSCNVQVAQAEPLTPVPRMDLLEALDCVRLRNWRGPVNREQPMRWSVAA